MKKLLATIMAITMVCGMTACGSSETSSSTNEKATTTSQTTAETTTTTAMSSEDETTTTSAETTTTTTTEENTTTAEETTTTQEETSAIASTSDYVNAIGTQLEITDITTMAADMIGAEEGTSFKFNGNKFEIYKFADGATQLTDGASGSLTYTLEGFGDFTSSTVVNGNYLMLFKTADDNVTNAFSSITL